ncbi:competence protein CoiA (plasmid) [Streptomyces sp. P8-A8]
MMYAPQLSPMTPQDARMRTDRYAQDGVAVCWVALQDRPWERVVPSLRVRFPQQRGETWTVWHGMVRYAWAPRTLKAKAKWEHITCSLGDAIKWVLEERVHVHTTMNGTVWWTAPAYERLALARAQLEAEAEAVKRAADAERRRQEAADKAAAAAQRRREAEERARERKRVREAELQRLAGFFAYAGLDALVWEAFTQMVRSASGKAIKYGDQSPAHGNGLLVYSRARWGGGEFGLAGVVCPDPKALARWPKDLTILVPNQTWLSRIQAAARSSLKVAVLNPVTGRIIFVRVAPPGAAGSPHRQDQVVRSEPGAGEPQHQGVNRVRVPHLHPPPPRRIASPTPLADNSFDALLAQGVVPEHGDVPVVGCRDDLDRRLDIGEELQE